MQVEDLVEFPNLEGWEATRDRLHSYVKVISAIPRALAVPHPKWWHISLKPHPQGAATDPIPYPDDPATSIQLVLNLRAHTLDLVPSGSDQRSLPLTEGLGPPALADRMLGELRQLGIEADLDPGQVDEQVSGRYSPEHAATYRAALHGAADVLGRLRQQLLEAAGPVQLWPHNFDLAFEWFGARAVSREHQGETRQDPAQINFGFAPGDASHPDPYFYSNPWPFAEQLVSQELPLGARWFTESWKGTLLPYAAMVDEPADKLLAYFRRVFELASPLLTE